MCNEYNGSTNQFTHDVWQSIMDMPDLPEQFPDKDSLESFVRNEVEAVLDTANCCISLASELLAGALSRVNWQEIHDNIMYEYHEQTMVAYIRDMLGFPKAKCWYSDSAKSWVYKEDFHKPMEAWHYLSDSYETSMEWLEDLYYDKLEGECYTDEDY